ncbi:MAG TPA: amino acid ABC transporter permease [Acidimicrobiales bacterium]|nr:amino acid ABC transporter permease [Acidimicrobiales bacterium]
MPVRHPGRWVAAAGVVVLALMLGHSLFFSHVVIFGHRRERFEWNIIGQYFLTSEVLKGLGITLALTVVAMTGGIAIGVVLAIMRLSPNPIVTGSSWLYIWFFRGTPVYVQLFFWFNASYLFPQVTLGIPFGPAFVHFNLNTWITPFVAASLGLALNEGAYMAEIVRAGIISVDYGQTEAANSLGMSRLLALRLIVLPQAMRVILPPTGNETISMLKTSSLASAITVSELFFSVQLIYATNYEIVPLLIVACIWYLAVTSVAMVGQYYLERHFARGSARQLPPTPLQRLRRARFSGNAAGFGRFPGVVGGESISMWQPTDE